MKPKRNPTTLRIPTVSRRLPNGELVELVYDPDAKRTQLAVGQGGAVRLVDEFALPDGSILIPYSATNNLIKHEVLLLAQRREEYGVVESLVMDIDAHLSRYVDLDPEFRILAVYYILLTWVYDAFNELPYLRFRGQYGSGKTRALLVVGSLCNRAFFASGASTVSPIFHTLDTFRGTLLFDEADFRFSDEKAELVKILNNGNVRGFPVLRTQISQKKEFEPRAFTVFGPKLVAMRRSYEDDALESRFFTAEMGRGALRSDIPINLPDVQREEARELRNKLLGYRFAMLPEVSADPSLVDPALPPRLNQILVPLLSIVEADDIREKIRAAVLAQHDARRVKDGDLVEQAAIRVLSRLRKEGQEKVSVGRITSLLIDDIGSTIDRPLTTRYVGEILRERLDLRTYKSGGVFVVPLGRPSELAEEKLPSSGVATPGTTSLPPQHPPSK